MASGKSISSGTLAGEAGGRGGGFSVSMIRDNLRLREDLEYSPAVSKIASFRLLWDLRYEVFLENIGHLRIFSRPDLISPYKSSQKCKSLTEPGHDETLPPGRYQSAPEPDARLDGLSACQAKMVVRQLFFRVP
jgi:hypothetical protein